MTYVGRLIDKALTDALVSFPAVLITGPRACGKTTSGRRHTTDLVRLDEPRSAATFAADPDAALRRLTGRPLLLDEWQAVAGIAGAVKRAVDDDASPGQFLLTGSVSAELRQEARPLTGRILRLPMYGLTMRERVAQLQAPSIVERLATGDLSALSPTGPQFDVTDYVEAACAGGFPLALAQPHASARRAWFTSYLDQLMTADVGDADRSRDTASLSRYLQAVALSTAGIPEHKTIYEAAGITRTTAVAYDSALVRVHAIELLPAWHTNRLKRLLKAPKRYVVDPGLAAAVLGTDPDQILRDGDLLGRMLDTFVYAQLRPELALSRHKAFHLRTESGRQEVDLVVDLGGRGVVGLEVKASAAPTAADARHLAWMRDELGSSFVAGAVLHTGPDAFALGDRLFAVPIRSIWQA